MSAAAIDNSHLQNYFHLDDNTWRSTDTSRLKLQNMAFSIFEKSKVHIRAFGNMKQWAENISVLLTSREIKMAGYWPSSIFWMFIDRDEVEVHKKAKKERG